MVYTLCMKKTTLAWIFVSLVVLAGFLIIAIGDFRVSLYSKNLNCGQIAISREMEICKSIENHQTYEFTGHAIISFGYRMNFTDARNAWCELDIQPQDKPVLGKMQHGYYRDSLGQSDSRISNGAGILYSLLDAKLNPNSDLYSNSIYLPQSPEYLLKIPCQ